MKKRTIATDARAQILHEWQVRHVCEYIDAHFGTRIPICDLSAITKRNERHFARAFRRTFGETPRAHLVRRRVELASQMMLRSDAPLSEIALTCGFSDQAHGGYGRATVLELKGQTPITSVSGVTIDWD